MYIYVEWRRRKVSGTRRRGSQLFLQHLSRRCLSPLRPPGRRTTSAAWRTPSRSHLQTAKGKKKKNSPSFSLSLSAFSIRRVIQNFPIALQNKSVIICQGTSSCVSLAAGWARKRNFNRRAAGGAGKKTSKHPVTGPSLEPSVNWNVFFFFLLICIYKYKKDARPPAFGRCKQTDEPHERVYLYPNTAECPVAFFRGNLTACWAYRLSFPRDPVDNSKERRRQGEKRGGGCRCVEINKILCVILRRV